MTEPLRILPRSEPPPEQARLLKAFEVAEILGVSTPTVLRWARGGSLPSIKLPGGPVRFREDIVEAWLDEMTRGEGDAG